MTDHDNPGMFAPASTIAAPPRESARASGRSRGRRGGGAGAGAVTSTLLALVCVALAGGGWFVFNQGRQLAASESALGDAAGRIAALEDRLRMTDETLSETDAATDDKLSFWEQEIRKVWDIANKRNKKWIEENRASIKAASSALTSAQADLNGLKTIVTRLDTSAQRQQEVADLVTSLEMRFQRMERAQRDLVDKANVAAQSASRLEATLESRVGDNEQAIAAIDASRTTVTRQLTELRRDITALSQRIANGTAPPAFTN